ncbi:MAG: HAD family hydrolase [Nanoarchaeota archaeon]
MDKFFSSIKIIGFDLDNTLYPISEEIDYRIKAEIAKRILEKKPELNSLEKAIEFSEKRYSELGSRSQVLREIGLSNPEQIVDECLATADIIDLLKYDKEVASLIKDLSKMFQIFLVTGSPKNLAIAKLKKIGIPAGLFKIKIYGDNPSLKKIDGSVFNYLLKKSKYAPEQHVYIGDNLLADILPTKALGIKTIAVGRKFKEADYCVDSIKEIRSLLF